MRVDIIQFGLMVVEITCWSEIFHRCSGERRSILFTSFSYSNHSVSPGARRHLLWYVSLLFGSGFSFNLSPSCILPLNNICINLLIFFLFKIFKQSSISWRGHIKIMKRNKNISYYLYDHSASCPAESTERQAGHSVLCSVSGFWHGATRKHCAASEFI